jgi:DNA-binding MarR family transcriptional regulator
MATTDTTHTPHYAPTAGVLLLKVGKAAEQRFEKALKPLGLTPRHLAVMFEVQACPTSQQALIETVGVDPSKLVGLLNDLEAEGLIARKRDTEDRRRHIVEVSAKGSARLEDAKKIAATVEEELLAGLDADQRAELLVLLAQVADSSGIFEGCVERLKLV